MTNRTALSPSSSSTRWRLADAHRQCMHRPDSGVELAALVCLCGAERVSSTTCSQLQVQGSNLSQTVCSYLRREERPEDRPRIAVLWLSPARGARSEDYLFNNFYNSTAAWLHNHWPIVHDRVPIVRPHMVLARHCVERYASLRDHVADARLAAITERGMVLTYNVFAKPRPLFDAQDAADGTGCGADRTTTIAPSGAF
jgi:hypothetical protein